MLLDGEGLEEDGDALDRLVAEGPLHCGKLERMGDLVREVIVIERVCG